MTLLVTSHRNLTQIGLNKIKGSQKDMGAFLKKQRKNQGTSLEDDRYCQDYGVATHLLHSLCLASFSSPAAKQCSPCGGKHGWLQLLCRSFHFSHGPLFLVLSLKNPEKEFWLFSLGSSAWPAPSNRGGLGRSQNTKMARVITRVMGKSNFLEEGMLSR